MCYYSLMEAGIRIMESIYFIIQKIRVLVKAAVLKMAKWRLNK